MNENECEVIGLVLARGGSVAIERKNLVTLDGDTLLGRCLKTMKISGGEYLVLKTWNGTSADSAEQLSSAQTAHRP